MTQAQMEKSLASIGACFAFSAAKFVAPRGEDGVKPAYHIHPDSSNPHEGDIKRFETVKQMQDWIRTQKAAKAATSDEAAFEIQQSYHARWA